jgi:hypothetical protein
MKNTKKKSPRPRVRRRRKVRAVESKKFFPPTSQMGLPTFTPWDVSGRHVRDKKLESLATANLSLTQ